MPPSPSLDAVLDRKGPLYHLHPLVGSCCRDEWKKWGGCLSVLGTHLPTTLVVALGCCSPKRHQPQGWQEDTSTGRCVYDGQRDWLMGILAPTPTSNTSFSNQPCSGARLAAGKVPPCHQSIQWVPTPPDLIPCAPHWCSPL